MVSRLLPSAPDSCDACSADDARNGGSHLSSLRIPRPELQERDLKWAGHRARHIPSRQNVGRIQGPPPNEAVLEKEKRHPRFVQLAVFGPTILRQTHIVVMTVPSIMLRTLKGTTPNHPTIQENKSTVWPEAKHG